MPTITTFNTWKNEGNYSERLPLIIQQALSLQSDVLLLQEAFSTLDGTVNTAESIAKAVDKPVFQVPARIKHRNVEGQSVLSSSGLAIISHFPLLLHKGFDIPSNELDGGRKAQIAVLNMNHIDVAIANVHLTHLPQSAALRTEQLRFVVHELSTYRVHHMVIAGDFNCTPEGEELQWLMKNGFKHAYTPLNQPFEGTGPFRSNSRKSLDHIFFQSDTLYPLNASLAFNQPAEQEDSLYPSDHFGLNTVFYAAATSN